MFLMLTGTIDPSVFNNTNVKITAAEERLEQYVDSIKKYIDCGTFNKIAFVENSGYEFPIESVTEYVKKHNAQFELVRIQTDIEKTIKYGKSYGEADCIEKGIQNSKLIDGEEYFVKCTGRVFVSNISKMCKKHQNENRFLFREQIKWCYSLIFQMNVEEYKKYFFKAKDICNEKEGMDIESTFYKIIFDNNIKYRVFSTFPNVQGLIGTTGRPYNEFYLWYSFLNKLGLLSPNRRSRFIYGIYNKLKTKREMTKTSKNGQ